MTNEDQTAETVSKTIHDRRTAKVLANENCELFHSDQVLKRCDGLVGEAITDAGMAPFHYDRGLNGIAEPWRFHWIKQQECRNLSKQLPDWYPEMKPSNKLPAMLAACGSLVLINWLPQFGWSTEDQKQLQIDEEHLAATAAATQNFLLSLTSRGLKTYWSSGGFFRMDSMFDRLGIASTEKLLAAIFVDYGAADNVEIVSGKQHGNRQAYSAWTTTIQLN